MRKLMMDWSRTEVEAVVEDYLSMLGCELLRTPYSKAAHWRALQQKLSGRSRGSVEFKHANISAALINAGFPYIDGYKPYFNYQQLIAEVLAERLPDAEALLRIAAEDVERSTPVPEVYDILATLTERPPPRPLKSGTPPFRRGLATNYLEREARNQSLGLAGELFAIEYERARLVRAGRESLAARIEHTARVRGDGEGYDVLSFEESGQERFIEVKTTKYGVDTPFYVSSNEVDTSERNAECYRLYRLFSFSKAPRFFSLAGAIKSTCRLSPSAYLARSR